MHNYKINPGAKWQKNRGAILVLMTIALPVLLLIVGLAIDAARAYGVKANLSKAVDAASLAAARAVANGESAAITAANKYFNANYYPDDSFDTTIVNPLSVGFTYSTAGDITINASATANMPTTLVKLMGMGDMDIPSSAQTIRRVVDLSFVVDNTGSLKYGTDVTEDVKARSKDFISNFHEGLDRIALVKYAFGAEVPVPFNNARGFSKSTVETEIDAFDFAGYTNTSEGMWRAIDALETANNPASLRVIVFFTDGAPNTFSSSFSFKDVPDHVGSIRSGDFNEWKWNRVPYGLWEADQVEKKSPVSWNFDDDISYELTGLPEYYNAHDLSATDFRIINPSHPRRRVFDYDPKNETRYDLYKKINRISRNLPEDMAEYARKDGIFVLTLGLGEKLTQTLGPDNERGDEMLIRMANDPRMLNMPDLAADFKADQPQGVYCYAEDEDALAPCFAEMLAVIIRLTL